MTGEDRTEAATPRKRQELRRRGQVARSADLSSLLALTGVVLCLNALGASSIHRLQQYLRDSLSLTTQDSPLSAHLAAAGLVIAQTVGPLVLCAMALGVLACILQTGLLASTQALLPDFTRINPLAGARRLLSGRAAVEAAKAACKLAIIAWIGWSTLSAGYPDILRLGALDLSQLMHHGARLLYTLAMRICLFLLVLSALDYAWQRWSFEKSIRMTKEEVKQEMRQTEGSPQLKARIRARQRQMARRRMMDAVPTADVVVANPTHYAVALKYEAASMRAPQVVAKGADLLAARIRQIAEENRVPIVENPPLARTLYRTVEIGREIPGSLYAAVAEVLAFVYDLNARQRAGT